MSDAAAREQHDTETDAEGHGLRVPFSADATEHGPVQETPQTPVTRRRLARLIAFKLALDLLFVGAFALYTHAFAVRHGFEGALEQIDGHGARGWVTDLEQPGEPVELQLFLNGKLAASTVAREPLPDASMGATQGGARRIFVFEFERYGEYEARVYAVRAERGGTRRTLHLIGEPRHFWWK
jgi:hypothetical protein